MEHANEYRRLFGALLFNADATLRAPALVSIFPTIGILFPLALSFFWTTGRPRPSRHHRRAEYKRKQYEELAAGCPAEGGANSDLSLFEFACDDHKCVRKEKRKRNGLDY